MKGIETLGAGMYEKAQLFARQLKKNKLIVKRWGVQPIEKKKV